MSSQSHEPNKVSHFHTTAYGFGNTLHFIVFFRCISPLDKNRPPNTCIFLFTLRLGGMLSRSTGAAAQSHIRDLSILVARGCDQFARRATGTVSSRMSNKFPLVILSQRAFSISDSTPADVSTVSASSASSAPAEESTPVPTSSPRRPIIKTSPTNEVRFFLPGILSVS